MVDDGGVATADGVGRRQCRAAWQTAVANGERAARQTTTTVSATTGGGNPGRQPGAGWRGKLGRPRQPWLAAGGGGGRTGGRVGGRAGGYRRGVGWRLPAAVGTEACGWARRRLLVLERRRRNEFTAVAVGLFE
jgi:hypothetical protein